MRRLLVWSLVVVLGTCGPGLFAPSHAAAPSILVSGSGVGMYPAFDPAVLRYAITTSTETAGSVTVTASPGASIDGTPGSGPVTVTGLEEGDEISVGVDGSSYALVYLPPDFPALDVTSHEQGLAPGYVGMGLTTFGAGAVFDTLIDRNGVPIWIHRGAGSDLKRQPNGDLTTFRPTTAAGHTGSDLVTLDESFREVDRQHVVGDLTDTDNHDAVRLADGSTFLIGYEPRGPVGTGHLDATIQEVDGNGEVVFEWSSEGLEGETLNPLPWPTNADQQRIDYAHINSIEVIGDGTRDVVVSFRHFSAVYRIATRDHDGYQAGEVVWRLGGRHSDFTFVDDPDFGPCAQHTASILDNGHLLVFDNGSGALGSSAAGCVDPQDPLGDGVERRHTRIAEWALDTEAHTATLVWSYQPEVGGREPFAFFAGSSRRLANGNTLIGWADERAMLASEVAPDGTLLWEVQTPQTGSPTTRYATYRASLVEYDDAIAPTVTPGVADDAVFVVGDAVAPTFRCTDRGGSNLQSCAATGLRSGLLDTAAAGNFEWTVTGEDGMANVTSVTRHYTVRAPRRRPDAMIRTAGSAGWRGANVYGPVTGQRVRQHARRGSTAGSRWRVRNDGERPESFRLVGPAGNERWKVRYFTGSTDVTRAVVAGRYRTGMLAPGHHRTLRVAVTATRQTNVDEQREFTLRAISVASSTAIDRVATLVTVRR